ncbi:MAG: hypothetical protein D6786_08665 [Gammaproteobacteria bacterium]|nr:MAG: hypothetical protein D6786_08665 [Gammaproteobacteria bacterium]
MSTSEIECELRPEYLEEWLEALPYANFGHATGRILQALIITNRTRLRPSVRLELMGLYLRPLHYLMEQRVGELPQPTAELLHRRQQDLMVLQDIAGELASGCHQAVNEILMKKTRWLLTRPPTRGMVMTMHLLGLVMFLCYHRYETPERRLWREIHDLYLAAERLQTEDEPVRLPELEELPARSVRHCFLRTLALSQLNPHTLPYGALWPMYRQLDEWIGKARLLPWQEGLEGGPSGRFACDLNGHGPPRSLSREGPPEGGEGLRVLDLSGLLEEIGRALRLLERGENPTLIPSHLARPLLQHAGRAWGLPPRRHLPRQQKSGRTRLACGLTMLYLLAGGTGRQDEEEAEIELSDGGRPGSAPGLSTEEWNLIDVGSGGFSVLRREQPEAMLRVGDLIGIQPATRGGQWQIGAVRWLMVQRDGEHRLGVQFLGRLEEPVDLRPHGSDAPGRHALLLGPHAGRGPALVTERGLYQPGRQFELLSPEGRRVVQAGELLESSAVYDLFTLQSGVSSPGQSVA